MTIRVALNHQTTYQYDRLVSLQPHTFRLRPAPHCRTPIKSYSLRVEPIPHFINWQQDPFSNYLARVVFPEPTRQLRVEVDLVAEMTAINPFDFFVEPAAEKYPFEYEPLLRRELGPYLEATSHGPQLIALVEKLRRTEVRTIDYLVDLNQELYRLIRYVIRMEPGIQTCEETLSLKSGSCRDSAWLFVQICRHLGLAARFVSGYLIQLTADLKSLDGPSGPEQDFTDLHAWVEVYLPGAGWIGFDPTSGLAAGEGHIPLACAVEVAGAAPVTGSYAWTPSADNPEERCKETFHFRMSVKRIHETPRVTKPYSEEQWQAINALGESIDADLRKHDVRLTMGGEPTFVSIDNRDAPEWNVEALGNEKQLRADELLRRMRKEFAPGGLLHHGQGKWYPGESLPRWSYGCYWRRDGEPLWEKENLIARFDKPYGFGAAQAERFIKHLATRLGVDRGYCQPGYEDVWYLMWRERNLPTNVDPLKNNLDDPLERKRLSRLFDQGLHQIVGYALPLRRRHDWPDNPVWESGNWFLRREHLFLIPGDSPMGYRLPLDSLPWEAESQRMKVYPLDPMAPRGPLPPRRGPQFQSEFAGNSGNTNGFNSAGSNTFPGDGRYSRESGPLGYDGLDGIPPGSQVRTALCVEPRQGRLHIFLPPLLYLEDFLALTATIEEVAGELDLPVLLEGYKPPSDHRLNHFQLTPDPGVLEVNIHPAHSWKELVHNTTTLYDQARLSRLSTEKFMLDGRHSGTGGGNHVVIGGPTPQDSPLLRRPDLLRSLIGFWHNHPSLSYLFSSLFIGPTSQAPRVDEARHDSLYELELAFSQIPDFAAQPPWLVDRVFRHLLVDVTGNTHRAEFCIDKLYSPDSSDGRRGLLELRAFEMPPHSRMSLVQQLVLRSAIARFWKSPYRQKLVRWGTELHDRFLLPFFVEQDFQDVLFEMKQAGYVFDPVWFAPQLEFRFPQIGQVTHRGVQIELRQAIEPWHVLGEEATQGGTARFVDSSVERLQVLVRGMTDPRHFLTCNGRRVPLHPTGTNGEFVAGIRYRAWQPPTCLHPTIGVNTPLVFDLMDTWNECSIGGCQYHVTHPGGRAFETLPVNAGEAESRRRARFFSMGHTPGIRQKAKMPDGERIREAPLTLDLRRPQVRTTFGDSMVATSEVNRSPGVGVEV